MSQLVKTKRQANSKILRGSSNKKMLKISQFVTNSVVLNLFIDTETHTNTERISHKCHKHFT
jgi:hypothetical protein